MDYCNEKNYIKGITLGRQKKGGNLGIFIKVISSVG